MKPNISSTKTETRDKRNTHRSNGGDICNFYWQFYPKNIFSWRFKGTTNSVPQTHARTHAHTHAHNTKYTSPPSATTVPSPPLRTSASRKAVVHASCLFIRSLIRSVRLSPFFEQMLTPTYQHRHIKYTHTHPKLLFFSIPLQSRKIDRSLYTELPLNFSIALSCSLLPTTENASELVLFANERERQ